MSDDLFKSMFPGGGFGAKKAQTPIKSTNKSTNSSKGGFELNMFKKNSPVQKKQPIDLNLKKNSDNTDYDRARFQSAKEIKRDEDSEYVKVTPTSSTLTEYTTNLPSDHIYDKVRHFEEEQPDRESDDENQDIQQEVSTTIFPLKNFVKLQGHTNAVSSITIDPSGSRIISGSHDYSIKFWDFSGMNQSLQSFRCKEEASGGCYPINHLAFSITGDSFLMAPDTVQCKLFDRDGFPLATFKKGDPYISDMNKTAGHIASLTGACWHPKHRELCLTSSVDGTLRVWDIDRCEDSQRTVIKARNHRGTRASITCCAFQSDSMIAGCKDGSIQMWDSRVSAQRPTVLIRDAHVENSIITCVTVSRDDHTVVTRCTDHTLKVWDVRQAQSPIYQEAELNNMYDQTTVCFSPDERYLLTSTSCAQLDKGHVLEPGRLVIYDRYNNYNKVYDKSIDEEKVVNSIIGIIWHPNINQMLLSCSDGTIRVGYDEEVSRKGALISMSKAVKKRNIDDVDMSAPVIHAPFALPMFKKEPSKRRQEEKARKDPIKSKRPSDAPSNGPGHGGNVSDNMTHMLMKQMGVVKKATEWQEDPREALLKYDESAKNSVSVVSSAYAKTQPVPIFDYDYLKRETKEQLQRELQDEEKSAENRFSKKPRLE
ncbi:WD repeat-containing protein [Acrasis kona]|uniref:WD repeat-containing protein n=1 Tax=Acrasis kona TaxID=1008807 RepID=A0AAW2Z2W8_9EUKA